MPEIAEKPSLSIGQYDRFLAVYAQALPFSCRCAFKFQLSLDDGRDLLHDALVKLLANPLRLETYDFPQVAKAIRNTAIDKVRRTKRSRQMVCDIEQVCSSTEMSLWGESALDTEKQVIDRLSLEHALRASTPRERQIFELMLEGFEDNEIADLLSITRQAVSQARKRLAKRYIPRRNRALVQAQIPTKRKEVIP